MPLHTNLSVKSKRSIQLLASTAILTLSSLTANAQTVVDGNCIPFLQEIFEPVNPGSYVSYQVKGGRVKVGTAGITFSFSMQEQYQTSTNLNNSTSAIQSTFFFGPVDGSGSQFSGKFASVFPERDSGGVDLTTLIIEDNFRVSIILNDFGDTELNMTGLSCYFAGGIVFGKPVFAMTGHSFENGAINFYSFGFQPETVVTPGG